MSLGAIVSILVGLAFVTLAGLEARHQLRMPLWLTWPFGALVVIVGVRLAGPTNEDQILSRWREGGGTLVFIVVGTAYIVWTIGRWRGWQPLRISVLASALALVQSMTVIPDGGYLPRWRVDALDSLAACVAGQSPIDALSVHQLKINLLPNIVFFVPFGIALALCLHRRWLSLPLVVLASVAIEAYQAMFTNRLCAPADVLSNTIGGFAGALLVMLVAAITGSEDAARRHPKASEGHRRGIRGIERSVRQDGKHD